ncbi:MAG: hypothetical protein JW814_06675 [Candidatus Krumholzibacteriota bacterium]|nr:hypothetical protein [Candidatus Krumholzibacteriota bacterium]
MSKRNKEEKPDRIEYYYDRTIPPEHKPWFKDVIRRMIQDLLSNDMHMGTMWGMLNKNIDRYNFYPRGDLIAFGVSAKNASNMLVQVVADGQCFVIIFSDKYIADVLNGKEQN